MRALLPLAACLVLAACGSSGLAADTAEPVASPERPQDPPPARGAEAPPPAWVATEAGAFWLGYSSFCWKSLCVDYVAAPERHDLPTIPVREGERVRFHLGFRAAELTLYTPAGDSVELDPADPTWTVDGAGAFSLFVVAAAGEDGADASYAGVLVVGL